MEIKIFDDMVNKYDPKDIVKYVADQIKIAETLYSKAIQEDNKYQIANAMIMTFQCGTVLDKLAVKMNGGKKQQKVL